MAGACKAAWLIVSAQKSQPVERWRCKCDKSSAWILNKISKVVSKTRTFESEDIIQSSHWFSETRLFHMFTNSWHLNQLWKSLARRDLSNINHNYPKKTQNMSKTKNLCCNIMKTLWSPALELQSSKSQPTHCWWKKSDYDVIAES